MRDTNYASYHYENSAYIFRKSVEVRHRSFVKNCPHSGDLCFFLKAEYSVMPSDGNSLCGDVVLESFNGVSVMKTALMTKDMKSIFFVYLF